jgi:hypothetical protein
MHTYPILTAGDARIRAFEIEHAYVTTRAITRLLAKVDGVTGIRRRSLSRDVKVEFFFRSRPYVVWEPHGVDGRYWIGPDAEAAFGDEVDALRTVFEQYRPPLWRALYGGFVTSRLFTHPFRKHHHSRRSRPVRAG